MAKARPSVIDNLIEGYGGKVKTEQAFSAANQSNTNRLIRQGLGLGEGDKLTLDEVFSVREEAGQAYDAIKSHGGNFTETDAYRAALDRIDRVASNSTRKVLNNEQIKSLVQDLRGDFTPDEAIEVVKKLRADASLNITARDPNARALGFAQKRAAQAVDDLIGEHLEGTPLYESYRQARQVIAKTYDVEKALNSATGDVSGPKLAKLAAKRSLTSELKEVAEFAKAFPGAARDITQAGSRPGPAISPLDVATGAIGAAAGHGGMAHRALAGAAMLGRPLARKYLLSDMAQAGLRPQAAAPLEQRILPAAGALGGANLGVARPMSLQELMNSNNRQP
jgi:hypothetical protein